jgi:hypothetical protein
MALLFFGNPSGLPADRGDQFAGVFRGDTKTGMDHGSAAGLRYHPFSAEALAKGNGFNRTEADADTASFAGSRINGEDSFPFRVLFHGHGIEAAQFPANSAADTAILANDSLMPAPEYMPFLYPG